MRSAAIAGFLLLALAMGALRLVHLEADPAPSVPASVLTDEGWWARNARQEVLFGKTPLDEFNQGLYAAPVFNAVLTEAFRLEGVSFASARAVSAWSSLLTLAALGWLAWSFAGPRAAMWAVVTLGFSSLYLLFNRTAFVESFLILILTLTVAASAAGARNGRWFAVAGGLAALAFWTKPNSAYVFALPLLAILFPPGPRSDRWKRDLGLYALASAAVLVSLYAIFIGSAWDAWVSMDWHIASDYTGMTWTGVPQGLMQFPRNEFWGEIAPVGALVFALLLRAIAGGARAGGPERDSSPLPRLAVWWLALAAVSTLLLPYQPIRRMLTLLPPMCLLAALFFGSRREGAEERSPARGDRPARSPLRRGVELLFVLWPLASLLWGGWLAMKTLAAGIPARWETAGYTGGRSAILIGACAALLAVELARRSKTGEAYQALLAKLCAVASIYPAWMILRWICGRAREFSGPSNTMFFVVDIAAALAIPALCAWAFGRSAPRSGTEGDASFPSRWIGLIARPALFAALFAAANVPMILGLAFPSYSMREAGARIERLLPPGTVLVGPFADTLGLETSLTTVEARPHFGMNARPFETWPDAILVTAARDELQSEEHVPKWAPGDMNPILDLPIFPNPWTGEPRFILRLRGRQPAPASSGPSEVESAPGSA